MNQTCYLSLDINMQVVMVCVTFSNPQPWLWWQEQTMKSDLQEAWERFRLVQEVWCVLLPVRSMVMGRGACSHMRVSLVTWTLGRDGSEESKRETAGITAITGGIHLILWFLHLFCARFLRIFTHNLQVILYRLPITAQHTTGSWECLLIITLACTTERFSPMIWKTVLWGLGENSGARAKEQVSGKALTHRPQVCWGATLLGGKTGGHHSSKYFNGT